MLKSKCERAPVRENEAEAPPPPRKNMRQILREISPRHLHAVLRDAQIQIDGQLREIIQQVARQGAAAGTLFPDRLVAAGHSLIEQGRRLKATISSVSRPPQIQTKENML